MASFMRVRWLVAASAVVIGCGSDDEGGTPRPDVPAAEVGDDAVDAGEDVTAEAGDDAPVAQDAPAEVGDDAPGPDVDPPDVIGPDADPPDVSGPDAGPDAPGPDAPGPDAPGPDAPGPDAPGPDVGVDAPRPDVGVDAPRPDVGVDAPRPDVGIDVGPDAPRPDVGVDVGPDAPRPDAAMDAAIDRPVDAALDRPLEIGVDAPRPDAALDVAPDRAADVPPDGPACGNGRVEGTEECDDGNRARWDGCSDVCRLEQSVRVDNAGLVGGGRAIADACDLTGDRVNDNRLGQALTDLALGQVNMGLQTSFSNGGTIVLATLLDLDDRTGANDPAVRVAFFEGLDAMPPFAGTPGEGFAIRAMALDAMRNPVSVLAPGSIVARALNAGPGTAVLALDLGTGTPTPLTLHRATTRATTNFDSAAMRIGTLTAGRLCGAVTAGDLDRIPAPMGLPAGCLSPRGGTSLLDVIVAGCAISIIPVINAQQPDIDVAGDGIFQGGANRVLRDTNGDRIVDTCRDTAAGATITGDNCAQDPRMDDAYSMALTYTARRVVITQVR